MKRTRRLDETGIIYKLEWFDPILMTWKPAQRTYTSAEKAASNATGNRTWRLMEVSQHGYRSVPMPLLR